MSTRILLQKLIDIEKSIGKETDKTILYMVLDAEDHLLEMQREMTESLRHKPRQGVIRRIIGQFLGSSANSGRRYV